MSNDSDIHEMGRASVKYIPLHEKYEATAPSDDVSGASKKGKVPERSDSDTRGKGLASARESRKKIDKKDAGDGLSIFVKYQKIRKMKVYWPLDENWYYGHISGYNPLTDRHQVKYNDGDEEHLITVLTLILGPGDMIWAKVSGHPMGPAIVLDESASGNIELLNKISGEQSVLVQFFGTHDFARLSKKHIIPFLKGLLYELHRKCKR
ncbi:hypothetical protein POM88_002170 [Heracleum sosnowskyi]|uniref:PWWP domain-containing protein n=1 Tax=Heracleum sosnowskyi TaxID=360622 RepID=A0AAD8JI01_9APIA|nr:hypothetical protein POM88_002170 [Heracleum sosnowskyi]